MTTSIDYGLGQTNIDKSTGIRYGVIHQNEVLQAWADSSEPEYGEPHCPKCGNEVQPLDGAIEQYEDWEGSDTACGDYVCESCKYVFDSDEAFSDEPLSFLLDDGEYKAEQNGGDIDIFIIKSPYFTLCTFCSPCAPGAGYLMNDGNVRAYCFSHDWFEEGKAPYKVYSVATGEEVLPDAS